jgi:hypothetical protein
MAVTVMGQQLSMPIIMSPTGVQAVHPQGELAVARAAATLGAGRPADKVERQARVARSFTLLMASLIVLTFAAGYWVLSRAPMP